MSGYTSSGTRHLCLSSRVNKNTPVLLKDPVLKAIAEKHRCTPAQVALRFQLQRGVVALAKSFNEKRIQENFQVRGRAVGSRGPTEVPHFPRVWVICEAPEVCLGVYCVPLSAVCNCSILRLRQGGNVGKDSRGSGLGLDVVFFTPQYGLDFFRGRMEELDEM